MMTELAMDASRLQYKKNAAREVRGQFRGEAITDAPIEKMVNDFRYRSSGNVACRRPAGTRG
jgi:hypothetical protein